MGHTLTGGGGGGEKTAAETDECIKESRARREQSELVNAGRPAGKLTTMTAEEMEYFLMFG